MTTTTQSKENTVQFVPPEISLRDYFAGQALMSMLAAPDRITESTYGVATRVAYKFADAMLEAREAKP